MSYIYVRHANLLPFQLTVCEAWDLGPQYITLEDLTPVRDASAKLVSKSRGVHVPVEEPEAQVPAAEPVAAKSVNLSGAEANLEEEMVTRRTLTIDWFLPGGRLAAQPQKTPGKDRTPPPSFGHAKKKRRVADPLSQALGDVLVKTPPQGGIVIREPFGASWPAA